MFITEIIKIKEQSINAEESKLYKKMLDSLGVIYETEKIKKEQIDVPIYVLFEELDVRANNALRSVTNDITLSTFVKQYSKRDILRVRNVGKHTLTLVVEAFRKFGYELN